MTNVEITENIFGEMVHNKTKEKVPVKQYEIKNRNNVTIRVISYGATVVSIKTPNKNGILEDIVLGFDTMEGYQSKFNAYFGATVGRCANRIRDGKFVLNGKEYHLAKNMGNKTHLHGGLIGFDKVLWNSYTFEDKVVFRYLSEDGEEGYPGDLLVTVTYHLSNENKLSITYEASTTKPTPVNLTNHSYFNLAGHGSGSQGLYEHDVLINADYITEADDSIPTGKLLPVEGTTYDLRKSVNLGKMIQKRQRGYDDNFCLNKAEYIAKVTHSVSGRYLEVFTNQPGIQFYTGNSLSEGKGKENTHFGKHAAFCLETQNFPNSVNIDSFPKCILNPGEKYEHILVYTFGILSDL